MGREIRLIRALADEGYQYRPQRRRAADPARPRWSRSASCRSTSPGGSWTRSRPAAIPVLMLRGDGQINPDGVRDYDLLVPGIGRGAGDRAPRRRPRDAPTRREADGLARRRTCRRRDGVDPRPREPLACGRSSSAATRRARSGSTARSSGRSGRGWSSCSGVGPDDDEASPTRSPGGSRSCGSSTTTRAGRTCR